MKQTIIILLFALQLFPHCGSVGKNSLPRRRSKASIMRTIRTIIPSLQKAYEKRLDARSYFQGKIVFSWNITPNGRVTDCKIVDKSLDDPIFEKELMRIIVNRQFKMIHPHGEIHQCTYPFVFLK